MNFKTNKKTFIPFIILLVICVASVYVFQKYVITNWMPYNIIKWSWNDTISCHYETEGDALLPAEEMTPPEDSIFFHETSCRGGLNSREACAVESAATLHPDRHVYLFFNSPVSEKVLTRSCLAKLTQFKNVRLARLHTAKYAKGTALDELLANKKNDHSHWRIELTSDMLRYISMYKYGGVYLDTDVLVVKRLDSLGKNWVGREDNTVVNVAVLAISKDGVGHQLVTNILDDLKYNYQPDNWLNNGPGAMTRALLKFCNTTNVESLNANICHGFNVYDPSLFYPVPWQDADIYFKLGKLPVGSEQVYTHHWWNKMTRDKLFEVNSPYDRLTRQHCPTIREMYGDQFGW